MATNANEGGASGANDRRSSSSSAAAAVGEVVGDDSMVVGKGIMIKGDVDNCAVREERFIHLLYLLVNPSAVCAETATPLVFQPWCLVFLWKTSGDATAVYRVEYGHKI